AWSLLLSKFSAVDTSLIDRDKYTGLYLTDKLCAHDIQRTGFGSNNPALRQAANNQGAHTVRVTRGVQGLAIGKGQAKSAFDAWQQLLSGVKDRVAFPDSVRQQSCHDH